MQGAMHGVSNLGDSLERLRAAHVIDEQCPKRILVVDSRDGAEPVLPRNVPEL